MSEAKDQTEAADGQSHLTVVLGTILGKINGLL